MVDESINPGGIQDEGESDAPDSQKRGRSTIEFPYSDLETAIDVARMIYERAGAACEVNQLASWMDQSPKGGTFRSRLSAARIFGLVETERGHGRVAISDLGRDIIDAIKGPSARVAAFLTVPLYSAMYEEYNGYSLPPAAALERQMIAFGVSKKQADRARQAFSKSAQQAGFIDAQTGRFIKPGIVAEPHHEEDTKNDEKGGTGGGGGGEPPKIDPIIQGLIDRLPPSGEVWPKEKRKLWLQILESSFDLVYLDSPMEKVFQPKEPDDDEPAE